MPEDRRQSDAWLMQLAGAPGVGKSSLARAIGAATMAMVLDRDVIKSALLDAGLPVEQAGAVSFDVMFAMAHDQLLARRSVVLDTTSHYPDVPERSARLAEALDVRFAFIECVLDNSSELERRLTTRPRRSSQMGRFDVTPAGSSAIKIGTHRWKTFGPGDSWPILSTEGPLESCLQSALQVIGFDRDASGQPSMARGAQ